MDGRAILTMEVSSRIMNSIAASKARAVQRFRAVVCILVISFVSFSELAKNRVGGAPGLRWSLREIWNESSRMLAGMPFQGGQYGQNKVLTPMACDHQPGASLFNLACASFHAVAANM